MSSPITHLCFVRHGETDWNTELRMQGHRDLPLNAQGLEQAEQAGRYFSGKPFVAIYCSDLLRAQQTAKPIAMALKLPVTLCTALRERNFGRCEGLIFSEVARQYEEDAHALKSRDPDYVLPGGESLYQHQQRVLDCVNQLARDHAGQSIVVVTHGGVLDLVYRRASGMALEKPRDFRIPNTGINWIAIRDGEWSIEQWANTTHLGNHQAIDLIK